jgi:hypothetical protein
MLSTLSTCVRPSNIKFKLGQQGHQDTDMLIEVSNIKETNLSILRPNFIWGHQDTLLYKQCQALESWGSSCNYYMLGYQGYRTSCVFLRERESWLSPFWSYLQLGKTLFINAVRKELESFVTLMNRIWCLARDELRNYFNRKRKHTWWILGKIIYYHFTCSRDSRCSTITLNKHNLQGEDR